MVVGGGVVGTAIAALLQRVEGNSVLLVEQHRSLGSETTSRNLEVVHAGLYYPRNSLKARLCVRGNYLLRHWALQSDFPVPLETCGKWIVGNSNAEAERLHQLQERASANGVLTRLVPAAKAHAEMPQLSAEYILESPHTGITGAHDLTQWFEAAFTIAGGTVALRTRLEGVELQFSGGARYTLLLRDPHQHFHICADNLVNAAGLHATTVSNMVLPTERHITPFFAKGTYYSYCPASKPSGRPISRLVYPCPAGHGQSLGTHLTVDLAGQVRFGPDLEWLDEHNPGALDYAPSASNLSQAVRAIQTYMPHVTEACLTPSYSGIRPKLGGPDRPASDFVIRCEEGFPGFVNLLGIESPGLTASPAIAEHVAHLYDC